MNDFSTSEKISFAHLSANGDEKAEIFGRGAAVKKAQFYNKGALERRRNYSECASKKE